MTLRLLKIDETNIGDHWDLRDDDQCFYIYEYTSNRDYTLSQTNSLINNLKKKPTSSEAQLFHKGRAIGHCAAALRGTMNPECTSSDVLGQSGWGFSGELALSGFDI